MRRRGLLFTVFIPLCLVIIFQFIRVFVNHGDQLTEIQKFQSENPASMYQLKAEMAQIGMVKNSLRKYYQSVMEFGYITNTVTQKALDDYKSRDYANFEMPKPQKAKKGKKGKGKTPDPKIQIYFNSRQMEQALQNLRINTTVPIMNNRYKTLKDDVTAPMTEMNQFVATVKSLESYVQGKKYKKDSGQYLKDQNEIVIEQATAYIKAANDMMDIMIKANDDFDAWRLESVKKINDKRLTNLTEMDIVIWRYSQQFYISIFRGNEDFSSKELQQKSDKILKEVQERYDTWMKSVDDSKDDPDKQKYKTLEPKITAVINFYKQFKERNYPMDDIDRMDETLQAYLDAFNNLSN